MKEESICLCDWSGDDNHPGYWYDYHYGHKSVKFGGALSAIPNFYTGEEPTEGQCEDWICKHSDLDFRSLETLTVLIITYVISDFDDVVKLFKTMLKIKKLAK